MDTKNLLDFSYTKKKNERYFLKIIKGTILSILIFGAISFFSVLYTLRFPNEIHEIKIGFPFTYYQRFRVDLEAPNVGWSGAYLFIDCAICWSITLVLYLVFSRR